MTDPPKKPVASGGVWRGSETKDARGIPARARAVHGRGLLNAAVILLAAIAGLIAFGMIRESKNKMALDEAHPIAAVKNAEPIVAMAAAPRDETPFHETHLVFAHRPQASVINTDRDARSGYEVNLAPAPGKPDEFEATVTGPSGVSRTLSVRDAGGGWANLFGDGDPIMFRVAKYWPDFAMKDGGPISVSGQPRNPAALVEITGPTKLLPAHAR